MQLVSTTRAPRELYGVVKTLRHVYSPVYEPSPAIARALEALARREAHAATLPQPMREFASVA